MSAQQTRSSLEHECHAQQSTNTKTPSSFSKCTPCLDVLVWPLTCCLTISCWNQRPFVLYDLILQCSGIFITLIALLWTSAFTILIEAVRGKQEIDILLIVSYCTMTYILCNVVVIALQRTNMFGERITFFVMVLGQMAAFGFKELTQWIMDSCFQSSYLFEWLFLLILLVVAIIFISVLSVVRKNFCFAVRGGIEWQRSLLFEEVATQNRSRFEAERQFNRLIRRVDRMAFTVSVG